ncbi:MAG: hypothetical protein Q7U12_09885 [Undibacterium sp.]|nr:hypothetical protein [Undibacterium sp.]
MRVSSHSGLQGAWIGRERGGINGKIVFRQSTNTHVTSGRYSR